MQKVKVTSKAELARIEDSTSVIVSRAKLLIVTTVALENRAYEILKKIKAQWKMVEGKRTAITKPLSQSLTETNALFRPITTPLKEAEKIVNDKILEFKLGQEKIAEVKMAKKEKIQASHKARGHETHELVPEIVETGKTTMQKRWTYDLISLKEVPFPYIKLNLGAIQEAINAGERNIPGLKIYQKTGLSVRE